MISLLLVIIYLSFISLGLPDSILGSAWPIMYQELKVPLSYSGIIFILITMGTVLSSLSSERIIVKYGAGKIIFVSVLLTALGMLGFSFSHIFSLLCVFAIPYGLGAGSIDTALNNYVALYYESKHMSWLHCMWGVGATLGPLIMSTMLNYGKNWNSGYRVVSIIQFILCIILFLSLPLWNKNKHDDNSNQYQHQHHQHHQHRQHQHNHNNYSEERMLNQSRIGNKTEESLEINSMSNLKSERYVNYNDDDTTNTNNDSTTGFTNTMDISMVNSENSKSRKDKYDTSIAIRIENSEKESDDQEVLGLIRTIKLPKAKDAMLFFFCYCAIEQTIGLWASSYLVMECDVPEVTASRFASLFYIGITIGRAISGFVTLRLNDNQMIYLGEGIILVGIFLIIIPFSYWVALIGFILSGLGCAPLFPSMIHATPENFGKDKSQAVIGIQMASAYSGVLIMPPFFGLISKWIGLRILPFYLGILLIVMVIMHIKVMKI